LALISWRSLRLFSAISAIGRLAVFHRFFSFFVTSVTGDKFRDSIDWRDEIRGAVGLAWASVCPGWKY
jgi:hypothetical protein